MVDRAQQIREFVARRAEQIGKSLSEMSKALGKNHAYLQQFVTRGVPRILPEDVRPGLAVLLDCSENDLRILPLKPLPGGGSLIDPVRPVELVRSIVPGDQLVGARDFPIYAAAQGGNGHMIVHTDVMEYVKRPVILEGVPDAYGILVTGTSMIPAFRQGDMALVHPRRPPERETDVILFDHDHRTGDAKAMIKRLLGFNDRSWKLEQYNPAETFTEHRADWPICHQVVGKYNAR